MAYTYTLISSTTLTSATTTITFSSIPQTYTDLVLKLSARGTDGFQSQDIYLLPNSSTSSQTNISLALNSTTVSSAVNYQLGRFIGFAPSTTSVANSFSNTEVYIPNYTVTGSKPMNSFSTRPDTTASRQNITALAKLNQATAAITSLQVVSPSNFEVGSSFYLYGIKNS